MRKRKTILDMLHITRFDYCYNGKCTKGWLVRLFANMEVIARKFFSDSKYIGGKEEALSYAQGWRDEKLVELKPMFRESDWKCYPPPYMSKQRKDNKSGMVGVFRSSIIQQKPSGFYVNEAWVATWRENKKSRCKRFSIHAHGEEGAQKLAIDRRRKAEIQLREDNKHMLVQE